MGKKAVRIVIDGIVSDPTKDTWRSFLNYANGPYANLAIVDFELFTSLKDQKEYIEYLKEIGII